MEDTEININYKISYYQNQLESPTFANRVWKILSDIQDDVDDSVKFEFKKHLPLNFARFLSECSNLIQVNGQAQQIDPKFINKRYFISLIYVALQECHNVSEYDCVPTQGAILFLVSFCYDILDICDTIFLSLFKRSLLALQTHCEFNYVVPAKAIVILNDFLSRHSHKLFSCIELICCTLRLILTNQPPQKLSKGTTDIFRYILKT